MPTCPQCGTRIQSGIAGHLCLNCLLSFGLKERAAQLDDDEEDETPALRDVARDEFDRFRLLEKIGEGGCGVVYRAEQLQPVRREVALKVIKLGLDTSNVIARFEAERQALALMDHPGIAKVFDAGSSRSGRPFFVMELVTGERITDFCDQRQWSIAQRLELFARVCEAVQHAHQKGIIHRDLKPSNILVTEHDGVAQPKVIDFGIAKATSRQRLADQTIYTAFDQFVGTPAYMSPEQAGATGEDVDTRSDIYSLGVLLYELLTGRPPFEPERLRQAAVDEVFRIIRDEEPVRPSARLTTLNASESSDLSLRRNSTPSKLLREMRGDLDWVVMKALEKLPARRYQTANALALEVRCHLNHEPVLARPPGAAYRLKKFVRRNRVVTAAVASVSLALIVGTVISTVQAARAKRAETEQRRLREEAQTAATRALAESEASQNIFTLMGNIYSTRRREPTRRRVTWTHTDLEQVIRERSTGELKEKAPLLNRILFLLLLSDYLPAYGETEGAERLLREAVELTTQLEPGHEDIRAGALECFAFRIYVSGRGEEAEKLFRQSLTLRENSARSTPLTIHACLAYGFLAGRAREHGDLATAEKMSDLHVAALREKVGATNLAVAQALQDYGKVFQANGDWAKAELIFSQTLTVFEATLPSRNDNDFVELLFNLGEVRRKVGNTNGARDAYQSALKSKGGFEGGVQIWTMPAALALANLEFALGNTNAAEQCFRNAIESVDKQRPQWEKVMFQALDGYAAFCRQIQNPEELDRIAVEAAGLCLRPDVDPRSSTIDLLRSAADYQIARGNASNAAVRARMALAIVERPQTTRTTVIIYAHRFAAGVFAEIGQKAESEREVDRMAAAATAAAQACITGKAQPTGALIESIGESAKHLGSVSRHKEAEAQFRMAIDLARRLPKSDYQTRRTYDLFASYLASQKRLEEAQVVRAEVKNLRAANGLPAK